MTRYRSIPSNNLEFGNHCAPQFLVALQQAGKLTCVISQNVDGLHTRSGITRDRLAELHGSCFVENCGRCRREYVREFELDTVRSHVELCCTERPAMWKSARV